jgi:DNA repair exonuclease SbcCD ATPase subunit
MNPALVATKNRIAELKLELHTAKARVESDKIDAENAAHQLVVREEAHFLIAESALLVQQSVHRQVSVLVTRCLAAVFDDPYEFEIKFERKRNSTEARIVFKRGDSELHPMSASGGGAIDVATFALRLACLLLRNPNPRRVLILDEPFRFLSVQYRPRIRQLIEALSEEFDCQFIMVTHIDELRIGKVIDLGSSAQEGV